jgi:hypothetical protein
MARFYDPRQGKENQPFNTRVGRKGFLEYDAQNKAGTSGAEVSDLRPEQAYDTDLRRIDPEERGAASSLNNKQDRIAKFMAAARSAGKFKQQAQIDEMTTNGRTPRQEASFKGTAFPSMGDTIGTAGSTNYADKPQTRSGTFRGF